MTDQNLPVEAPVTAPVPSAATPDYIALALERDNLDALERAISIRDREMAKEAERNGRLSLARFQAQCPAIPKGKQVKNRDGTVRYEYAPLDELLQAIRPAMADNGLSVRWESEDTENGERIKVTCIVTHSDGYQVRSPQVVEASTVGGTNSQQARGSAVTYGKRYSLMDALGIVPVGTDDDARAFEGSGPYQAILRMMEFLRLPDVLESVLRVKVGFREDGDITVGAEAYAELSKEEISALWIAPSKGGIWTTEERRRIKGDEEFHSLVQTRRAESGWHDREAS